jgi:hypothetical protein
MESLKITLHSEVDVITNSSTTIYTQVSEGGIETVKGIINSILKIGGSELTADDLFTFEITSEQLDEQRTEKLGDEGILSEYLGREISYRDNDYNEKIQELFDKIQSGEYPKPEWWAYGYGSNYGGHECTTEIKVTSKLDNENTKIAAELLSNLNSLFHSEEGSN